MLGFTRGDWTHQCVFMNGILTLLLKVQANEPGSPQLFLHKSAVVENELSSHWDVTKSNKVTINRVKVLRRKFP